MNPEGVAATGSVKPSATGSVKPSATGSVKPSGLTQDESFTANLGKDRLA